MALNHVASSASGGCPSRRAQIILVAVFLGVFAWMNSSHAVSSGAARPRFDAHLLVQRPTALRSEASGVQFSAGARPGGHQTLLPPATPKEAVSSLGLAGESVKPATVAAVEADAPAAAATNGKHELPSCSVVFFHHLEKTGGTTLRSILQRHAQLGEFDFISFVNRFDKLQLQMVLHRLHRLVESDAPLDGLRLAVEIHIGGHNNHPYFNMYTLPDLMLIRSMLRSRGCSCNLVTLLRHPLLHHLSWHYHFCNHRVPLCFWRNPPDCQARLGMGLACHDGPNLKPLSSTHERAVQNMWDAFDLVGITEKFDEFVILLTGLVGLPRQPAYRYQIVAQHTLVRQEEQKNWTGRTCAQLLAAPPSDLLSLMQKRMEGSAANAAAHLRNNGGSSTGGPRGHMECRGYGPCIVPGVEGRARSVDMKYDAARCAVVGVADVLRRMCEHIAIDETLYLRARAAFDAKLGRAMPASALRSRIDALQEAGRKLSRRADEQKATAVRELERQSGVKLQRAYVMSSGGGVPWRVDELGGWYLPHERARFSCSNCSGDVVPEKDLIGCWPLWAQFAPDELTYRCSRLWSADPGLQDPDLYRKRGAPMPCWQTCWTPMRAARGAGLRRRCTAPCPADAMPAIEWRKQWDAQRAKWVRDTTEGRAWREAHTFVTPLPMQNFIFSVY